MLAVVQKRFMGKRIKLRGFSTQTTTYTKPLNPPAISFETKEGGAMLSEAMAEGTAEGSVALVRGSHGRGFGDHGEYPEKRNSFDNFAELAREHVDIEAFKAQHSSLEQFTDSVIETTSVEDLHMILSYSRKKVNQVYDGEEENLMSQSYGEIDEKCRSEY
ncbi:hypothetical protein LOK49_LG15G02420 [Camellia lanceoleosa]|uniref:Uncharacterized protein n=1 Tax=Camellia lanceoleosa TaxID=1840588 RepID=A0ACC0F7I2_9ERIC|nr:hypothetical protein LOK49_LG15G02420 [Camellia lanceoleosa]